MQVAQPTIIGLDVGRSAVKAKTYAYGIYNEVVFPSVVSLATNLSDAATAAKAELETVEVEGKRYFTGDTARFQSGATISAGLSDDWTESAEYKALVLSTLKRLAAMGVPGLENPFVVVGTPANQFSVQRERLEKITQEVVGGEVRALSQPMGAYLSYVLADNGMPVPARMQDGFGHPKSYAVVEVGYFTTDFLLMKEGQYVESKSKSCEGIYLASENLVRILAEKRGITTSLLACDQALRQRTIKHFGIQEVGEEVDEAAEFVVAKIMAQANYLYSKEVGDLDGILLAGGGAPVVSASLQAKWPTVKLLTNPRMAVAEGYVKFARGMLLKRSMTNAAGATA